MNAAQFVVSETHDDEATDCDLPVGPECTLDHLFGVLAPGASMTLRLAGDELLIDNLNEQAVDKHDA